MPPEMMMVIDFKGQEMQQMGLTGLGGAGVFASGAPFLISFPGNVSSIVQANKLHHHAQPLRSAQLMTT